MEDGLIPWPCWLMPIGAGLLGPAKDEPDRCDMPFALPDACCPLLSKPFAAIFGRLQGGCDATLPFGQAISTDLGDAARSLAAASSCCLHALLLLLLCVFLRCLLLPLDASRAARNLGIQQVRSDPRPLPSLKPTEDAGKLRS